MFGYNSKQNVGGWGRLVGRPESLNWTGLLSMSGEMPIFWRNVIIKNDKWSFINLFVVAKEFSYRPPSPRWLNFLSSFSHRLLLRKCYSPLSARLIICFVFCFVFSSPFFFWSIIIKCDSGDIGVSWTQHRSNRIGSAYYSIPILCFTS